MEPDLTAHQRLGTAAKSVISRWEFESTFFNDETLMASDQTDSLQQVLARTRATAITRLVTLTGLSADDCRETFLFENDCFCGVRWSLGETKAIWRAGSEDIKYHQGERSMVSEQVDPPDPVRRAA